MNKSKKIQEILPWDNGELKLILEGLIAHGTETSKVDFKAEIEISTPEQKAELLKDITAIANTYDNENYDDHGFLVYGVKAKTIVGITQTELDTDKFQNHIEQLLKSYISPMPQVYVLEFETDDSKKWGAIVIPPRNNKPHMFFKDFSCVDRTRTRKKGEWFVRHGATTDPGLPEDLAIITQRQMEISLEPLRESIRSLQLRVSKTEEQYNSALFKLVERAVSALPSTPDKKIEKNEEVTANIGEVIGMDLPSRLKQKLRTPKDAIAEDLIAETKAIRDFIDGPNTGLTWIPQLNDPEGNKKIIEDLEEKTRALQISIATILLNDDKNIYTDTLLRVIKMLAKALEVPSGISYNRIGEAVRYYPLGLILYTVFICGVSANRGSILKEVLEIPLRHRKREQTSEITDIFFFWHEARALFNDAFVQRWCEPIVQRIRQVVNDQISGMVSDLSEPEFFFRGEFVLSLNNIEKSMNGGAGVDHRMPLPGLYLYMHEAEDVIKGFLYEYPDWFDKLYTHPMTEILDMFDANADKMVSSGCIAIGISRLKTSEIYQEAFRKKLAKKK